MLASLPKRNDPNLLVGYDTSDDAGIYKLTDEMALVATADYITPPVDDPFLFGQIAAANAISDIYAMGARPVTCINLVSFPSKKLGPDTLNRIIAGALNKITEAQAVLIGGHSVDDDEPKFGLAVNGLVHPRKYWSNAGVRPGDVLILTKPLGSGVIFNANLKRLVSDRALKACLDIITTLNKTAAETARGFEIHAATDVTGFGLAGHAFEMARGSDVTVRIHIDTLPVMDEALDMYKRGVSTGVNAATRELVAAHIRYERELPAWHREILFDPQTSGGLLFSLPESQGKALVQALNQAGMQDAALIGDVVTSQNQRRLIIR